MNQTILLADDDEFVRSFVSVILKSNGYDLLLADSAESALERVRSASRLDLLIADLGLPDLSGTRLFEKVSALHPKARPLYISGCTEEEASDLYESEGIQWDFLGKPFLYRDLMSHIERILTRPTK